MSEALGVRGEFRLLHKIGEGGMADVFLAERLGDDGFRTRVALKRLHRGLAMDSYFIRQLVREARLLGQLEHANIVRVFDLRRIGDEYYVVMEYVDGIDLAAVIKVHRTRKTRIPRPFFFHVALSLTESLAYAHNAVDPEGNATPLIHRDIKPSNVMLSRRGVVKLTDFGIAHVGDGSVTGGLVQGTANYMSPEQAFGEDRLTAASDVYSLGSVFYEMLAGRPLIDGDNYLKAIHQVRERRVTIDELAQFGVEPGLRMVVAKMLSADVAGRYQEMDSARNDLQFVADRLKVDLSWHRIRAYVGRLMGILGRAPDRATLSNVSIEAMQAEQPRALPIGPSTAPPPRPSSQPGGPVGPATPATPVPQRRLERSGPVTQAVQKDMLDSYVAMAELEASQHGQASDAQDGLEPLTPATPRPAAPLAPPSSALDQVTHAGPPPRMTSEFAAGTPVGSHPPRPALSPTGRPRSGFAHTPPAPAQAEGRAPAPASAWKDEERTRVYGGPTPAEMGVAGTGEMRALQLDLDQDRTRPLPLGGPASLSPAARTTPAPPASQRPRSTGTGTMRPISEPLDDPTRFYAGAPPASPQPPMPPPHAPPPGAGGAPLDEDTETETWVFDEGSEPAPPVRRRRKRRPGSRKRRKRSMVNPRLIGLLIILIMVLISVLVLLAAQRFGVAASTRPGPRDAQVAMMDDQTLWASRSSDRLAPLRPASALREDSP